MTVKEFNNCIQKLKEGNNRGLEAIYNCYYKKLVSSGSVYEMDHAMSQDAASNVIANILKNAKNYDYISNPDAWMYSAFKNAAVDLLRQYGNEIPTDFTEFDIPDESMDDSFSLAFDYEMRKCSKRQRDIVYMYFVYGLKLNEISKLLDISISTIKREISAVREQLRSLTKKY